MPLWFAIGYWPVAFCGYLVVYHSLFLGLAVLNNRFPKLRTPTPVLGFIALVPTVYMCKHVVVYMSNGTFPYDVVSQFIFYFFSVQGLETVFYRFILPGVREDIEAHSTERHLIIGGDKIDLARLLHIEAREHHVHLTFEDTQSRTRARLGDIVAQTKPEDGVQPHRSWWVARDAAVGTERKDGRMILRLRDGTEVPVARTRIDEVQSWFDSHVAAAE